MLGGIASLLGMCGPARRESGWTRKQGQGWPVAEIRYCTREDVKVALDYKETARANGLIDIAIEAASRDVEELCHRKFYPLLATRKFDWPNRQFAKPWRLWLDQHELIEVTTLTSGGVTIGAADYFLYPDDGPPYTRLEVDLDSTSAFGLGSTHQKDISILGLFGYSNTEVAAGALAEALDATEVGVDVTNSAAVGVGSLIRVDTERMLVVEKSMLSTGQTLQTPLTALASADSVAITNGAAFFPGETILLDSERMLVLDILGNTLLVKRGWDGSTLATHTGSTVYAPRTLTVERGRVGTTAATHLTGMSLVRHAPPSPVRQYTKALAIDNLLQDSAGWARTSGSGDNERESGGRGLAKLRDRVYGAYGRKARIRGV